MSNTATATVNPLDQVEFLVARRARAEARAAELRRELAAINEELRSVVGLGNQVDLPDGTRVRFAEEPDNRFDSRTFREDHPGLHEEYMTRGTKQVLRVTKSKVRG